MYFIMCVYMPIVYFSYFRESCYGQFIQHRVFPYKGFLQHKMRLKSDLRVSAVVFLLTAVLSPSRRMYILPLCRFHRENGVPGRTFTCLRTAMSIFIGRTAGNLASHAVLLGDRI